MIVRPLRRICIVLLLVVPLLTPAGAQGAERDEAWRREARDLSFEADTEGFVAESTRTSARGDDELTVRYLLDEGRLETRFVSTEPGNETLLTLRLAFHSVVEFADENGDGRYGFGDRVVQRIPLDGMAGSSLTTEPRLAGGHLATASYTFPRSDDGNDSSLPIGERDPDLLPRTLVLRFYVVPTPQQVGDVDVAPLDVKFDVLVQRFPFEEGGTRLALETRLTSSAALEAAEAAPRRLTAEAAPFGGFLHWSEAARVDGTLRPVYVTRQTAGSGAPSQADDASGEGMALAFAYPRGETILHDPVVGFTRAEARVADLVERLVAGDLLLYTLGLVGTLVAVGVPAAKRLRET